MAVIAFTSATGAPGVTTTALAVALQWQRSNLLLEADVSGSSSILAGYLRGGRPHRTGLIDVADAQRHGGDITGTLHQASIALTDPSGRLTSSRLLPGLSSPSQARTIAPMWEELPVVLHGLEQAAVDVIVDAGRLGAVGGPLPLLRRADLVVLVTRSNLPAVAAARASAAGLRAELAASEAGAEALQLVVVGEGQPYRSREIAASVGARVMASVAWDPVNAEVLSLGAKPRKFETSGLYRSITALTGALNDAVYARRNRLASKGA